MTRYPTLTNWSPPDHWQTLTTIDMHTGGEPLRIFTGGLPPIPGTTVLEKRRHFRDHLDHIRTGTMWEPRGHADMYGAVITEPVTPEADFGTFFLHNEGYSTMCGHAIIALTKLALETGLVAKDGDRPEVVIDAPCGQIRATAERDASGTVGRVAFFNVPSFVLHENLSVNVHGIGAVTCDVAYGGAFYAVTSAKALKLPLDEDHYARIIAAGRRIKRAVMAAVDIVHPFEADLGFLYGTIFVGPAVDPAHHSRNVCVFAEGEVDRSPTGSGVSARAAIHHRRGELPLNRPVTVESILGTTMQVSVAATTVFGPHRAVVPRVSGTARITGQHRFCFDPDDPLKDGFILR